MATAARDKLSTGYQYQDEQEPFHSPDSIAGLQMADDITTPACVSLDLALVMIHQNLRDFRSGKFDRRKLAFTQHFPHHGATQENTIFL